MKQTKKDKRRLIAAANAQANPLDLISDAGSITFEHNAKGGATGCRCTIQHYKANTLPPDQLQWILDLMARNMKHLYESSSWGWNSEEKRTEMTEDAAQYLILRQAEKLESKPLAFAHFRFDMDHGRPVVYCYEIQVEPAAQGMKLGSRLLSLLESLAVATNIPRIVLTVLLNNPRSVCFFRHHGYMDDETNLEGDRDYRILSKRIRNQ